MEGQGRIRVITGEGKGKTTTALGFAWKAVGRGRKVLMVQFLKAPDTSGEHFSAKAFGSQFTIKPMGRKGFIRKGRPESRDARMAETALEEASTAMTGGEYGVIVLDEVNVAIHLGLINVERLIDLLDRKPKDIELVLTGRDAHPEVIERADTVLDMRKIKHPFDDGVPAREAIEY